MAAALSRYSSITSFNLSANRIGPDGGKALATAFVNNTCLVHLDLFGNELEVPLGLGLAHYWSV